MKATGPAPGPRFVPQSPASRLPPSDHCEQRCTGYFRRAMWREQGMKLRTGTRFLQSIYLLIVLGLCCGALFPAGLAYAAVPRCCPKGPESEAPHHRGEASAPIACPESGQSQDGQLQYQKLWRRRIYAAPTDSCLDGGASHLRQAGFAHRLKDNCIRLVRRF